MSEPIQICLVGSTGLTGSALIEQAVGREDVRLHAIARRQVPLPKGARMVLVVGETADWPTEIAGSGARVLVCALGTTWRKAGKDEAAFRAVDFDLVLACARAAKAGGIDHAIVVSSVGANVHSKRLYLKVKGEMEAAVIKCGFRRLDILRPGLLRGARSELRFAERAAMVLSPLADLVLRGSFVKYRSIHADVLAATIYALVKEKAGGRFVHESESMRRVLRRRGG
jgi:uncharacterized protein YbjT (DUF2867 family)